MCVWMKYTSMTECSSLRYSSWASAGRALFLFNYAPWLSFNRTESIHTVHEWIMFKQRMRLLLNIPYWVRALIDSLHLWFIRAYINHLANVVTIVIINLRLACILNKLVTHHYRWKHGHWLMLVTKVNSRLHRSISCLWPYLRWVIYLSLVLRVDAVWI